MAGYNKELMGEISANGGVHIVNGMPEYCFGQASLNNALVPSLAKRKFHILPPAGIHLQ